MRGPRLGAVPMSKKSKAADAAFLMSDIIFIPCGTIISYIEVSTYVAQG